MKLYVLFGQRKCSYEGEYAPEALSIADEWTMDENPQYMGQELDKYIKSKEFTSLEIIPVEVSLQEIRERLLPPSPIKGTIIE